jgi:hypothetical protein
MEQCRAGGAAMPLAWQPRTKMPRRALAVLAGLAAWHLGCWLLWQLYQHGVAGAFVSYYQSQHGDLQASYATYSRLDTYVSIDAITVPSTTLALLLARWLSRPTPSWARTGGALVAWQLAVVAALMLSYETGLAYAINQIDWAVFGPPANLYGFRNLILPRLIVWFAVTTPISIAALWCPASRTTVASDQPT